MDIKDWPFSDGVVYVAVEGKFKRGRPAKKLAKRLWKYRTGGSRYFILCMRKCQFAYGAESVLKAIIWGLRFRRARIRVVAEDERTVSRLKKQRIKAYPSLIDAMDGFDPEPLPRRWLHKMNSRQ